MPDASILPRALICEQADHAAQLAARTGISQPCPHPPGSDTAAVWKAAYERYLLLHSAPEGVNVEGGA